MWNKIIDKNRRRQSSGTNVSLTELIALRHHCLPHSFAINNRSQGHWAGGHLANKRGRGVEFDTTREYQAGDDIRHMAWRVTARRLQAHVKLHHEEKDRPVWLAMDLSPSLYFGTRCMFKSVKIIKHAACLAWLAIHQKERVGALIALPSQILVHPVKTDERELMLILQTLAASSALKPAFTQDNVLGQLLSSLAHRIRTGQIINLFSDFFGLDDCNKKTILQIAKRAHTRLFFVYDPFEAMAPPAYEYMVTDDKKIIRFNMDEMQNRQAYEQQFQDKLNALKNFSMAHELELHILTTDQDRNDGSWMWNYRN